MNDRFYQQLDRIEAKIDRLDQRQDALIVTQTQQAGTLEAQHESLKEHIKRTNLLEEEFKPVKKHVGAVNLIWRGLVLLGAISVGAAEIYSSLRHP